LRGGNEYPTLVRKYEPKPIRIFLEDGSNDLNIYGGDWWMANQTMERALVFAGYEVSHEWGTGGHSGQHATAIFPEAVRWLWKDWPEPVKAGAGSQVIKDLLIPGEGWKLVADGYKFTEGPAANASGEVFFNDIPNSKAYKIGLDGKVSLFIEDTGRANGQAVAPDGRLYAVATGKQQVLAYDASGKPTVIAEGIRGNDLAIRHDGGFYVTQPGGTENANVVWFVSPSGDKKIVDQGLKAPNGIALSPDQSLLYVADYQSHWVYTYQVQPDGLLKNKQKYFRLHVPDTADAAGLDGMRVDREGRLYATSRMGIQVCDQAGRVNAIIPTPNGQVANVCFGGADFKTLFATCGDRVYRRKVRAEGLRPDQPPFKPTAPRL
jgi:gluconolactonase